MQQSGYRPPVTGEPLSAGTSRTSAFAARTGRDPGESPSAGAQGASPGLPRCCQGSAIHRAASARSRAPVPAYLSCFSLRIGLLQQGQVDQGLTGVEVFESDKAQVVNRIIIVCIVLWRAKQLTPAFNTHTRPVEFRVCMSAQGSRDTGCSIRCNSSCGTLPLTTPRRAVGGRLSGEMLPNLPGGREAWSCRS